MVEAVLTLAREPSRSAKIAGFCLIYAAIALILFPATFAAVLGAYPILRYYALIPPFLFAGFLIAAIRHQPRAPIGFMRDKLADRGLGAVLTIATFIIGATAFTTLKHEYSLLTPFFADPLLADADAALHFGDPWRHLRAITPAALDGLLFSLYSQLWFLELLATVLYAAFAANRDDRERYFATFAATAIVLSSVVRLAGSSAGPVFYDRIHGGGRFADLTATLLASPAGPKMLEVTNYLFESYTTHRSVLGTGIAAMPSLHVAFAFLNALFIASRSRIAGYVAWAYAGVILYGSVYFGWHYALDGYVSILFVALVWWWMSRLQNRRALGLAR